MNQFHYAAWAFAAGALIPVLAATNGSLARLTGNPVLAVVILFAIGLACSSAVLLVTGSHGAALVRQAPPWMFAGGLIVAFYVLSVSVLAPRFGVGNTIMFAVAAQICTSAVIDQFGLLGAIQKPLGAIRLAGLGLLIVGLTLTQLAAKKA